MLAEASTLEEVRNVRDSAEAARAYARAAELGLELQNKAAELKLRAERKAGSFLSQLHLRGGDRKSKRRTTKLSLEDLGVTRNQSKRWQLVASIPNDAFEQFVKEKNRSHQEITAAGLYHLARKLRSLKGSRSCRADHERRYPVLSSPSTPLELRDLIEELSNHRGLLAELLRPLYADGDEIVLQKSERRVVGRLLVEMEELLGELDRHAALAKFDGLA
ncbi:MAG: hypothetical protein RIB44_20835 [Lacipirellulaceae bacterium]